MRYGKTLTDAHTMKQNGKAGKVTGACNLSALVVARAAPGQLPERVLPGSEGNAARMARYHRCHRDAGV